MRVLFGLVVLVLDVIAILECIKSPLTSAKKAVWIILIIILPVVGMVLYFLIGKKK